MALAFVLGGGVCGGLAAGLLWTAQGVYYARFAAAHAEATGQRVEEVNATFASVFALWYLGSEGALKLLSTLILLHDTFTMRTVLAATYTGLSAVTAAIAWRTTPPAAGSDTTSSSGSSEASLPATLVARAVAVFALWRDEPRILLLAPFTIAYSLASAFLNSNVATELTDAVLGATSLGVLTAVLVLVGAVLSSTIASCAQRKVELIAAGALADLAAGTLVAVCYAAGLRTASRTTAWLVLLLYYGLMGVSRGVFESANKAIVADWFPSHRSEAFANVVFFNGLASAAAYLVFPSGDEGRVVGLATILIFALLAWPCVLWASRRTPPPAHDDPGGSKAGLLKS